MRVLIGACALLACVPLPARASPLFELVSGYGGGLQARHSGASAGSAYFNPALLPDAEAGLTLGAVVLRSEIGIGLDARSGGADVPSGIADAAHADGTRFASYPLATSLLQNGRAQQGFMTATQARPRQGASTGRETVTYETLGLVAKLLRQQLAVGLYMMLPNARFTTFKSFYVDEREQYSSNSLHPELYGDRLRAMSIAVAAGYRINHVLSLGLGATVTAGASAGAPVYVADAGKLNELQLNLDGNAKLRPNFHGGLALRAHRRLRLTATVHAPEKVVLDAHFTFLLASGTEERSRVSFVHDYMPWQVGFGTELDIIESPRAHLSMVGSVLYGRWSRYLDRHGEHPSGVSAWRDTVGVSAGLRARIGAWSSGADLQFQPSPVPPQTGRQNYVDNDRVGLGVTSEYAFGVMDTTFTLGGQMNVFLLLSRYQKKGDGVTDELPDDAVIGAQPVAGRAGLQTNNPGWPGFSSAGWVGTLGLYLRARF